MSPEYNFHLRVNVENNAEAQKVSELISLIRGVEEIRQWDIDVVPTGRYVIRSRRGIPDEDLIQLGQIIRSRRKELHISLRRLAQANEISPAYLSILEIGKNSRTGKPSRPNLEVLGGIITNLGFSPQGRVELWNLAGYFLPEMEPSLGVVPRGRRVSSSKDEFSRWAERFGATHLRNAA